MSENMRKIRVKNGLSMADAVKLLRPYYPRISKPAMSLAETPHLTGVMFTPRAKRIFMELVESPKSENRRRPCLRAFRLTKEHSDELNAFMGREGYTTKDAFLNHMVRDYIKRKATEAEAFSDLAKNTNSL